MKICIWIGLVASLFFLENARAELQKGFVLTQTSSELSLTFFENEETQFAIPVQKYEKGTKLYHWTNSAWANKISQQGELTSENMEKLIHNGVKKNFENYGGFYLSLDMFDSANFGPELLILELDQDLLGVDFKQAFRPEIFRSFDNDSVRLQAALKNLGIFGTFDKTYLNTITWLNIFDIRATRSIRMAQESDFDNSALTFSYLSYRTGLSKIIYECKRTDLYQTLSNRAKSTWRTFCR